MEEAARKVLAMEVPEEEYQEAKRIFARDKKEFYDWVKSRGNYRMLFLYYYCHMGCEAHEEYVKRGISDRIFFDTFRDLTYWCQNCRDEFGEYGINEYHWFFRHIELRIFRLGRLQFELAACGCDMKAVLPGGWPLEIKKGGYGYPYPHSPGRASGHRKSPGIL